MKRSELASAYTLSIVVGVLVVVASAGGLLLDGLYRNNPWTTSQFRGADLVRLGVVAPLLFTSLHFARRGSRRALLVWLGILWLTVYDYAFYLFGAAFNEFFLVYVAVFSFSALALILGLAHVDAEEVRSRFDERTPVRAVAAYLLAIALFLGGMWTAQALAFVFAGTVPPSLAASGHVTEIVFALDLSLLVPGLLLAAVWLAGRRPWGFVLAALMLVKGTLYPLALLGMGVFAARAGVDGTGGLTAFWLLFAVASLTASVAYLGRLDDGDVRRVPPKAAPHA